MTPMEEKKPETESDKVKREFSEEWLRRYAIKKNFYVDPHAAFSRLIEGLKSGNLFLCELDNQGELREHAERYLGIKIPGWDDFFFPVPVEENIGGGCDL